MKKYYLTNRYKLLFGSIWASPLIIIIPLCILFYFSSPDNGVIIIFSIFVVGTILESIHRIYSEYITVSQDGIMYHSMYSTIKANWTNVETVKIGRWWLFKLQGLILDNPEVKMRSFVSSVSLRISRSFISSKRFIPLSCFSDNWRDSELGQQIKQHAPHLFEQSPLERTSTN